MREYLKKPNEKFNLYNDDDHHKLVNENKINLLASKFDFPLTLKVDFPVFYCNLQENKINDWICNDGIFCNSWFFFSFLCIL